MTLARKGSRQLIVDGIPYRWSVTAGGETGAGIVVEPGERLGSRLLGRVEHGVAITPALVRSAILDALTAGWRAHQRGPDFVYRVVAPTAERPACEQCPACDYFSLPKRGEHEICPVCFWEDDGLDIDRLDVISGPNHTSLREALENFRTSGACDPGAAGQVLPAESRVRFRHAPR